MSCTQIAPPSAQFPGGSCRDDNTGNNVDCKATVCGNPPLAAGVAPFSATPAPQIGQAGTESFVFGSSTTTVRTLGQYMTDWANGVIGFPTSIAGLDPMTAALQSAQGYCAEAQGSLPDCTPGNIQAYSAQAASAIAAAVANNQTYGGYAPPPGTNTGGCGGVPCGQTTTAGAPVTNPNNGGVTGASNTPTINGSASGQPPQTVQTGAAPIHTKQGPITGTQIVATTPVVTNAPSTNQSQAYQATTGQTFRGVGVSNALLSLPCYNPSTSTWVPYVSGTTMCPGGASTASGGPQTSLTTGAQTPVQVGQAAGSGGATNTVMLVAAVGVLILLWVVLEKK
jgi:hypothetical protein